MKNKSFLWIWIIALIAAPIVLWILPSTTFDNGKIALCPSVFLFDIECWGCGITRAVMHFHHFDFAEAAFYNSAVFLIYPFLFFLWIRWLLQSLDSVDKLDISSFQNPILRFIVR